MLEAGWTVKIPANGRVLANEMSALWRAMYDAFTASRKGITCDEDWDPDPAPSPATGEKPTTRSER